MENKKVTALFLTAAMAASLMACGSSQGRNSAKPDSPKCTGKLTGEK